MSALISAAAFGAIGAAVLAIAAVGFTLQFGVTNYVNFAYGELVTFGAYVGWSVNQQFHVPVAVALLVGSAGTALLAFVVQRFIFTPFLRRRAQLLFLLIVTFIMSLILNDAIAAVWSTDFHEMPPLVSDAVHSFGPVIVSTDQLLFVAIAVVTMAAVHVLLRYTKLGRYMRAMSDDGSLAAVCGINTKMVADVTWLISGFVAGLAGVILAIQTHTFAPDLGDVYLFLIVSAVILGGIGRAYGAVVGAVVVGLATQLVVLIPGLPTTLSPVAVFALLIAIMVFRPQGLMGAVPRPVVER